MFIEDPLDSKHIVNRRGGGEEKREKEGGR